MTGRFASGVVPKIGSRFEPLAAAYPREAEIDFRSALAGADYSLQTVVGDLVESGKLRELLVTAEDKRLFMNVNALSDLQSA